METGWCCSAEAASGSLSLPMAMSLLFEYATEAMTITKATAAMP